MTCMQPEEKYVPGRFYTASYGWLLYPRLGHAGRDMIEWPTKNSCRYPVADNSFVQ